MTFRRAKPPLTDEEFIARLRKQMQASRKGPLVLCVLTGLCTLAMVAMMPITLHHFGEMERAFPNAKNEFHFGLLIGTALGLFFVLSLWQFFNSLTMVLSSQFRLHRLAIKYHDLATKPASASGTEST